MYKQTTQRWQENEHTQKTTPKPKDFSSINAFLNENVEDKKLKEKYEKEAA